MKRLRNKLLCFTLFLLVALPLPQGMAQQALVEEEIKLSNVIVLYECTFDVKLDESFADTWVAGHSDRLNLKMKFQKLTAPGSFLLTFENDGFAYFHTPAFTSFGSEGTYDFSENSGHLDGAVVKNYSANDKEPLFLRLVIDDMYGKPEISLFLHDGNSERGVFTPLSSTIYADNVHITVMFDDNNPDDAVYFLDEDNQKENTTENGDSAKEEPDPWYTDDKPVDYSDLSQDPRRWDDREKSLEAYGKYRDDDGVFHTIITLHGDSFGKDYDYTTEITASFSATLYEPTISSDGQITATYYHIARTVDNDTLPGKDLLKLQGNRGKMWLLGGDVEVRRADPNVEFNPDSHLTDDSSIYMEFIPLEWFDGSQYEHVVGAEGIASLRFRYRDSSKTVMESIQLEYDGHKDTVSIQDVTYTGKFISMFLKMVYPGNYRTIAKKLGVSL